MHYIEHIPCVGMNTHSHGSTSLAHAIYNTLAIEFPVIDYYYAAT